MTTKTLTRLIIASALTLPATAGLQVASPPPACAAVFAPLALDAEAPSLGAAILVRHPAIGPFRPNPGDTRSGSPRIVRITP